MITGWPTSLYSARDVGAAGAERARGALAVHAHRALLPVDAVHLAFGDVVRHVVDQLHAEPLPARAEDLLEGRADLVQHHLPVGEGEVAGAGHGREVLAGLRRAERRAGELPVGQLDPGARRHARHPAHVVGADLVAEPARAGVDHHHHLAGADAEGARGPLVEHVRDDLDLEEVVARAEAADLRAPALEGPAAHRRRVRAGHHAALLGVREVVLRRVPAPDEERGSLLGEPLQLALLEMQSAVRPGALRHTPHQLVHERLEPRPDVLQAEARSHEAHAAVDVEADAARRDHAAGLVHRGDAADGEAVAPVDVRHRDAGVDDAGQRGHVGDLLQRLLVAGLVEEARVRVHAPGHAHLSLGAIS